MKMLKFIIQWDWKLIQYMGELYVATNRMDEARKRLAVLENCNCKEYNELKQVIDGTKQSKY